MLTGSGASAVECAFAGSATITLQKELGAFSAAESANRSSISCHSNFTSCEKRLYDRNISNEKIFHFPLESLVGEIGILIQTIGSIVILRNIRHIGRFGTYILVNGQLSSFHRKIPMSKAI
jgi:hypothetical protein